jgi:hypothetical protein
MPPLRRDILLALAAEPESTSAEIARDLEKPSTTVWREVTALHMLGLLRAKRGPGKGSPTIYTVHEDWQEPLAFYSRKLIARGERASKSSSSVGRARRSATPRLWTPEWRASPAQAQAAKAG